MKTRDNEWLVSTTMASNIYTMGACEQIDPRQTIGNLYTIPNANTRILRAKLLLEECLETIRAMGVVVFAGKSEVVCITSTMTEMKFVQDPTANPNLINVIDGCADTIYVATGTLASFGVPDSAHIEAVNVANMKKFPNGVATLNVHGKYQKPEGWEDPFLKHKNIQDEIMKKFPPQFLFRKGGSWNGYMGRFHHTSEVLSFFHPRECLGERSKKNG